MVAATLSIAAIANQTEALSVTFNTTSRVGHKINGYKYLCMNEQGNQYDLEDKFNAFFESIGFVLLTEDEVEELDENEKKYVLYSSYVCQLVVGGPSNLSFTLRNNSGKIIFSSSENGYGMTATSDFKKASNKIIERIKQLNYSFDPTLVEKSTKKESSAKKTEENEKTEKVKLARQMKADGMTVEQIEKYTGLTANEIECL